jgi:hypothetical protein
MYLSNREVASMLEEIAGLLELQGANPFRVTAYRNAALTVRGWKRSLAGIFETEGKAGLEQLPDIGDSLAKKIGEMLRHGRSRALERLRRRQQQGDLLTTLPAVGPRLAERIRGALGAASLEDLFRAAYDGRLRRIDGLGYKRVQAIRESLASRLKRSAPPRQHEPLPDEPDVAVLLDIDREYRSQVARQRLVTTAPRQFNPQRRAWLPILRTQRHGRRFSAHYTNTAASHDLGRLHDWVVIYCTDKQAFGRWTVITGRWGPVRGRRIVRGREHECARHYAQGKPRQLSLPNVDPCASD